MQDPSRPLDAAPSPPVAGSLTELSGTVLESRYELGRVLGAGGMGAVFEAKHLRLGRTVAIKVLRPIFVGHEDYVKRFLREAKVASQIRNRNVVEIHDYGEAAGGLVYSVMELLHGQDLAHFLRAQPHRRLPWAYACNVLLQAANGLKAAHAGGIVHRDIKPANCFLTADDDGQLLVKIVDFGIAKVDDTDQTQQLTNTNEVLGTPSYIAPELVMSKSPASPRSDVYSLGVLAYRMLTGHVPFTGETSFHVLHRACFDPVPPLRNHVPELSPAVESLVLHMLAKDPDQRPQDMQAVRDALAAIGSETLATLRLDQPSGGAVGPSGPSTMPHGFGMQASAAARDHGPALTEVLTPGPLQQATPAPRAGRSVGAMVGIGLASLLAVLLGGLLAVQSLSKTPTEDAQASVEVPDLAPAVPAIDPDTPAAEPEPAEPEPAEPEPIEPEPIEPEPIEPAPIEPAPAEPEAAEPIEPEPAEPEPIEPEPSTKPKPVAKPKPAPSGPPSDATLIKRLTARIKSKCADSIATQSIKVSFIVLAEGKATAFNATPKGPSAQCAIDQVRGTAFRKRDEPDPIGFTVE